MDTGLKLLARIQLTRQKALRLLMWKLIEWLVPVSPLRKSLIERQNHTMIRVKDHEKSLKFYKDVFGMTLFRTSENADAKFNLYFLGYPGEKGISTTSANGVNPTAEREGLLELTWNYGTEKDANFKYHNGNDQPQGFGHICTFPEARVDMILIEAGVSVDDLDAACKRFEDLGVNWKKRLTDGRMKNVAFVLDPDNYCKCHSVLISRGLLAQS